MCCWGGSLVIGSPSLGLVGSRAWSQPPSQTWFQRAPRAWSQGPQALSRGPGNGLRGPGFGCGWPQAWSRGPPNLVSAPFRSWSQPPPPSIVQGPPEPGFREPPSLVSWVLRSWCQGALCAWSHEVPSLILEGTTSLVIGSPPPGLVSGVRAWSRGAFRILACLGARLRWVPRVGSPRQGRGPGRLSGRGVMTRLAGVRWWCVRVQKRLVGVPRWWVRVQVQLVGVGMGAMAADRGTPVVTFCRGGYGCNDGWYGKWCSEWGVHGVRRPPPMG